MEADNKLVEDWKDSLTDEEWNALLKKHGHYYHDIGINETEVIQMWKDEGCPEVKPVAEINNQKPVSYQKETVCDACRSIGITYLDCVCTYMKNYPTVTVEFEVCDCCGHVNDDEIPDTPFNREALGDDFFDYDIDEYIKSLKDEH